MHAHCTPVGGRGQNGGDGERGDVGESQRVGAIGKVAAQSPLEGPLGTVTASYYRISSPPARGHRAQCSNNHGNRIVPLHIYPQLWKHPLKNNALISAKTAGNFFNLIPVENIQYYKTTI